MWDPQMRDGRQATKREPKHKLLSRTYGQILPFYMTSTQVSEVYLLKNWRSKIIGY